MSASHTVKEATNKLMRFCTYRERCHKEVRQKLEELNMIPLAQDEIIGKLIEEGFLNEERFTRVFVRDKFRLKKWGKQRIIHELKFRAISDHLITTVLNEEIDPDDYYKTFEHLLNKRLKTISETHPLKIKQKLSGFLLRKGYESSMVYERLYDLDL